MILYMSALRFNSVIYYATFIAFMQGNAKQILKICRSSGRKEAETP